MKSYMFRGVHAAASSASAGEVLPAGHSAKSSPPTARILPLRRTDSPKPVAMQEPGTTDDDPGPQAA
jgi:hypothetical protein